MKRKKKNKKDRGAVGVVILSVVLATIIGVGIYMFQDSSIRSTPWGGYHSLQLHTFSIISPTANPTSAAPLVTPTVPCSDGSPIALDTTSQSSGDSVGSLTWNHTTSSASSCSTLLLVGISLSDVKSRGTFAVGSVTYGGKSLTKLRMIDGPLASAGSYHTELWYLLAPAAGTYPIVATFTTLSPGRWGDAVAGAESFFNVNPTTPLGTPAVNSGTAGPSYLSVPSVPGQVIVDVVGGYSSATVTNDPSQTQLWYRSVKPGQIGTTGVSSDKPAIGTATVMQWNNISAWSAIGIPVNK